MGEEPVAIIKDEVTLDGLTITREALQTKKESLKQTERLVETAPDTFHILERMEG